MMVTPAISALTSSLRFTLLKDFNPRAIASTETPYLVASAAAPVAFKTLYEPAMGNSKSAQCFSSFSTDHAVRFGSNFRSIARHVACSLNPYLSTGQNPLVTHSLTFGLES